MPSMTDPAARLLADGSIIPVGTGDGKSVAVVCRQGSSSIICKHHVACDSCPPPKRLRLAAVRGSWEDSGWQGWDVTWWAWATMTAGTTRKYRSPPVPKEYRPDKGRVTWTKGG